MTTAAKGCFPGHPKKKLRKRKVKYQSKLHKNDLGDLGLTCSYICHVTQQFHAIFDEENEKDVEFIGFSSEECGLRAYKRVNKKQEVASPSAADILGSNHSHHEKDKIVTRRSHALDQTQSNSQSQSMSSPPHSLSESPLKSDSLLTKSTDTSGSSCESAFSKYKNFKLDFHRLSKKAKNRNSYEGCSAEEQAKRKDTSTASLKYASDIYLAKNHTVPGQARSPIKPATFIPPASHPSMHVVPTSETSLKIKKGVRLKDDSQEQKKGSGHPEILAKALLARANRSRKPEGSDSPSRTTQSKDRRPKSPRAFVLPMKSARSARIIKANRKYLDEDSVRQINDRTVVLCDRDSDVGCSSPVVSLDSLTCPSEDAEEGKENVKTEVERTSPTLDNGRPNKPHRKPLIKEPTFCVRDENPDQSPPRKPHRSRRGGNKSTDSRLRARCVIKRARFKHPTSSEALILGPRCNEDQQVHQVAKNPIRPPTFTGPTLKKRGRLAKGSLTKHPGSPFGADPDLSDLGLSDGVWRKLCDVSHRKWVVGSCKRIIPLWTAQEIHNLLHGAHTFGGAWCSIARQYDFHELHKDANSVSMKGKSCQKLDLLNNAYKVKSSILLQLKPKLSDDPNVTVFTPKELSVRGLTANIHFNINTSRQRQRYFFNTAKERLQECKRNLDPLDYTKFQNRIFGTQLNALEDPGSATREFTHTVVKLADISHDDLYLGLSEKTMAIMLHPKMAADHKKVLWAHWEIHNILHGIHYFGIGAWVQIAEMYKFFETHDNIAIRGKFKSVCCRDLIVARKVRPDIFPKLHVVLSQKGKKYFTANRISVSICGLPKRGPATTPYEPPQIGGKPTRRRTRPGIPRERPRQTSMEASDSGSDRTPISPQRRAVHLFGAVPVWDEAKQPEVIDSSSETRTSDSKATPVLDALEDGLRRNMTSPATKSTTLSSSDHSLASLTNVQPSACAKVKTNSESKVQKTAGHRTRSISRDKPHSATKTKGRGPRIKHVCRRASLVTGGTKATFEDHSPHLSALPRDEREKITAQAERAKANGTPGVMSSSDSDDAKSHSKPSNHMTARRDRRSRKRGLNHRCGTCDTCLEPPCKTCDACREAVDVTGGPAERIGNCFNREPCLSPITHESTGQGKKFKKNQSESQPASRKSTRLQQQRVPLKSAPIVDSKSLTLTVNSTVTCGTTSDSAKTSYTGSASLSSPGYEHDVFESLNRRKQAIIKMDNWKGTYDLDLLWKCGGHALITSTSYPPQTVCFLCGSRGLPGDQSDALVYCSSCCEPFHGYCADDDFDHSNVRTSMKNGTWLCRRCQYCQVCGHPDNLLECRQCKKTYHDDCLGPSYPIKPSANKTWVCMQCVRCKSCGSSNPGNLPGAKWTFDCTLCQRCGNLYQKGNYCSICRKCYRDEDYECRMMQCAGCKRWIHSKCESLTVEMYTFLTHMPDSVQYKCPDCDERGERLKAEFDQGFLEADQQSFSRDLEKVRLFLRKLPDPPWKKAIKEETQSGLEAIIMALFHNKVTYCVLKKNEFQSKPAAACDPSRPSDLFAVRFAVHNHRYSSVGLFCSDVRFVLSLVNDDVDRAAVESAFRQEASSVFSWFNFETGKVRDSDDLPDDLLPDAVMPPLPEHDYAQWLDKDLYHHNGTPNPSPAKSSPGTPSRIPESSPSPLKESEDLRQCLFCSKYGDDASTGCGRLLYCGQDEWCHVNCALWSAEVYEQHDGSLENVHSAVSRGKMLKCDHCRLPGATVGCNTRDCPKNYHFLCARDATCAFQEDKKLFCARHVHHAKKTFDDGGFAVERLICVDNDEMRPNRRWQRGMLACSISVSIGSLTVHQLGKLGYASDARECLTPISYRMTRVFWSTFRVGKKAVYTISVMEQAPADLDNLDDPSSTCHTNTTISHSNQEAEDTTKHHSKMTTSSLVSPPHPCRTDLLERLKERSDIGPLSPLNRKAQSSVSDRRRKGKSGPGTYTIISNINRTLPQAITPLPPSPPPPPTSVFSADTSIHLSESTKNKTSLCSENPFLNKVLPQSPHHDPLKSSSSSSEASVPPVFSDPLLAKLIDLNTNTTTVEKVSVANFPSAFSSTNASDRFSEKPENLVHTSGVSIPLANPPNKEVSVSCSSSLQTGSSGSFLTTAASSIEGNVSCSTGKEFETSNQTANDSIVSDTRIHANSTKSCSNENSLVLERTEHISLETEPAKKSGSKTTIKSETEASPKRTWKEGIETQATSSVVSTEEQRFDLGSSLSDCQTKAPPVATSDCKPILSENETNSQPLITVATSTSVPVISLIQDARLATDMESQETTKTSLIERPPLWWHRRNLKLKKGLDSKRDQDRTSRNNSNSSELDPSYIVPPSERHRWKRRTGESSSEQARRNQKRVVGERVCKASEKTYADSDSEATSTCDKTPASSHESGSSALRESEAAGAAQPKLQTINRGVTARTSGLSIGQTQASSETRQTNPGTKPSGSSPNNGVKLTFGDRKQSISETFSSSDLPLSNGAAASSVSGRVGSEISSPEISDTDTSRESITSLDSLEWRTANSFQETTPLHVSNKNTDNLNDEDVSCVSGDILHDGTTRKDGLSPRRNVERTGLHVRPSNVASEDELSVNLSPRTKLRKFAHKSPKTAAALPKEINKEQETRQLQEKDRQRSKSHETPLISNSLVKKTGLPLIAETKAESRPDSNDDRPASRLGPGQLSNSCSTSLTSLTDATLKKRHPAATDNNVLDDSATTRRYPRRDTYTCLKSFSGLSPNYALASYSRKGKVNDRSKKNKRIKRKPNSRQEVKLKEEVSDSKRHASTDDRDMEKPLDFTPETEVLSENSSNEPTLTSTSSNVISGPCDVTPRNKGTVDGQQTTIQSSVSRSYDQEPPHKGLNSENQTLSEKESSEKLSSTVLDEEDAGKPTTNSYPDSLLDNSGTTSADAGVSNVVCCQDEVKDLVGDVLDTLDVDSDLKEKEVESIFFSPPTDAGRSLLDENDKSLEGASNLPTFHFNDSLEVMRGGGAEEEKAVPALDQSSTSINFTSPSEKSRLFSDLLSDVPSANAIPNPPLGIGNNVSLTSMDSIPMDMDISSQLIETTDHSLFNNTECPVLSADEVKTLLDGSAPETPAARLTLNPAFADRPPMTDTGISINHLQSAPMMAPNVFSISPSMTPQYITHPVQLPVMQPVIVRPPDIPFPAASLMTSPPAQQLIQTNVTPPSPVTYFNPMVESPSITPPSYCFPLQQYSQTVYRAPLVQSPCPVPYSLRVTMAMAGTLNSDQIVARSVAPVRVPRQKRPYRHRMVHGPKNRPTGPRKPRCKPDAPPPMVRSDKPLVYRPLLDTSSGLNMPKSSLLNDIQGGNILKQGEAFKSRKKQSSSRSPAAAPAFETISSACTQGGPDVQKQPVIIPNKPSSPTTPKPTKKIPVSSAKPTSDGAPLPQGSPVNEMASLDHLIEYYSAKNNLTTEEKAIVRSIISKQMQNKPLPFPANQPPLIASQPKSQAVTKSSVPKTAKKPAKRRRSTSKESVGSAKKKQKDKSPQPPQEVAKPLSALPDDDRGRPSVLFDIYSNRRSLMNHERKQPLAKVLTPYNIFLGNTKLSSNKENRLPPPPSNSKKMKECPHLVYEIKSDDGYFAKGTDLHDLIEKLLISAQECRSAEKGYNNSTALHSVMKPRSFLGVSHDAIRFIVEQLPGARHCPRYRAKYHKHKKIKEDISHINPHGCCRAEQYKGRSKPDMFSFLASKHRIPPSFQPERSQQDDMVQLSNRRATSMEDLPMAMRFRHLRTFSKEAVGVYRSSIHGRGLYCKRDIEDGEMIMEYTGQMIRKELTDKREKQYESKSIGCYMFRMDDFFVVDATLLGSAARFINHSCEPNCYSRIVHVEGKKHIVIFALRKIYRGEELTYDYKFPIEDETHKIACNCGARTCRKFMN